MTLLPAPREIDVTNTRELADWLYQLPDLPRAPLVQLPTPIHRLAHFGSHLGGPELWIKRDDLTGLAGGGNKSRKLEFLVGDALRTGADTLVTVGAIQSNHTRQTAAAAARCGLRCALMHCAWTRDAGPGYRHVGNILLSNILGAELYLDDRERSIEDKSPLEDLSEHLRGKGHQPYLIPGGASDHPLGSMGYVACAAEITRQSRDQDLHFDYVVHCTGSSSTQSGLIAGFAAMEAATRVIGVSDDNEVEIKKSRVLRLANATLETLALPQRVRPDDVEIMAATADPYGVANEEVLHGIQLLARSEGIMADPVYEGKAIRGLLNLAGEGRFEPDSRILLMHLGGTPAVHAYAGQFPPVEFTRFEP
ncbi:MAG: D-cysteine desulfhydrase family protein [Gemmatimonadetes bacterium]|nr:D-cysteine desulfhydrase family protein [Gemmatimonadota bacterium]MYG86281.1 D-cysteine desulfhydrase family protein [Gemmatimonadota bacterium]MYJ91014.1 D-cysteine desulfhydrase family protein [Gemmatimonadota bacterium]